AREIVGPLVDLDLVAAAQDPHARGLERGEPPERGQELAAEPPPLLAARLDSRAAIGAAAQLRPHRELPMTLVDALPEALRTDTGGRPDDGRAWWHVARDYPARLMRNKTFSRGADVRK